MSVFNGQLNPNEIFAALYNMIIWQQVFADNVYDTQSSLVDAARVDGGLFGDTKLYYATDALKSTAWGNDAEAENLLQVHRPADPKCQSIVLNVFRKISLTLDNYLTKRAWSTEDAFSSFNSVMLGWIRTTKRVYDSTLYNAFIGTAASTIGKQTKTLTLPTVTDDQEAQNRLQAQTIAADMSDTLVDLVDFSRNYNDYKFLRSYNLDSLIVVWSSKWWNKITKLDLPTIFHKDGLIDKMGEYTLPSRYFGDINTSGGTVPDTNTTIRALYEKDYTVSGTVTHVFPGDLLPNKATYAANETYTENPKVIYKIMHKNSVPFMSAFEAGTSFFNPLSLTENHYLVWGHNTLEYLKNYPMITVKSN